MQLKTSPKLPYLKLLSIVVFIVLFGFFRDYFLSQYNNYLYQLYYKDAAYKIDSEFNFLKGFNYMQLYYAKFFIIAFFCLVYYLIALYTLKLLFKEKKTFPITSLFYSCILLISLIFYLYGKMATDSEKFYELSRTFLALLQSPLLLMILIPAIKLGTKTNSN